jgi:hypothetical protein
MLHKITSHLQAGVMLHIVDNDQLIPLTSRLEGKIGVVRLDTKEKAKRNLDRMMHEAFEQPKKDALPAQN